MRESKFASISSAQLAGLTHTIKTNHYHDSWSEGEDNLVCIVDLLQLGSCLEHRLPQLIGIIWLGTQKNVPSQASRAACLEPHMTGFKQERLFNLACRLNPLVYHVLEPVSRDDLFFYCSDSGFLWKFFKLKLKLSRELQETSVEPQLSSIWRERSKRYLNKSFVVNST